MATVESVDPPLEAFRRYSAGDRRLPSVRPGSRGTWRGGARRSSALSDAVRSVPVLAPIRNIHLGQVGTGGAASDRVAWARAVMASSPEEQSRAGAIYAAHDEGAGRPRSIPIFPSPSLFMPDAVRPKPCRVGQARRMVVVVVEEEWRIDLDGDGAGDMTESRQAKGKMHQACKGPAGKKTGNGRSNR